MAFFSAKLFFLPVIIWIFFRYTTKLVFLFLRYVMGVSVEFQVSGLKSLRHVVVKLKKGTVESISIGEIRFSVRQLIVKLVTGFLSRDPKLKVLINDLEIVLRASRKRTQNKRPHSSQKTHKSGCRKWTVIANMARFLSVSITKLSLKTPKAAVEIKELALDIFKDGCGSKPSSTVKLNLVPVLVYLGDTQVNSSQASLCAGYAPSKTLVASSEKTSAPFKCEEFSLSCQFGLDREAGMAVNSVDIRSGDVSLCLNEELIFKKRSATDAFSQAENVVKVTNESVSTEQPQKKTAAMAIEKYASMFPEKLSFTLPKLDVKFEHWGESLLVDNKIIGIQLKGSKSQLTDGVGKSTRLDLQMEFSEIHLFREAGISLLEIIKLDIISSVHIPIEPTLPVRTETDIKLGGVQSNLITSRLTPWVRLHSSKKKKVVHREGSSSSEKPKTSRNKSIMWACSFTAPEMTILLYDLTCSPLYHGCLLLSRISANNTASSGMVAHVELGEFNLRMSDEHQECLKETLFGVETDVSSLIHAGKVRVDWGRKDTDSSEDVVKRNVGLHVDVTGMGMLMTLRRLESLVATAFSFKSLLKSFSTSGKKKPGPDIQGSKTSKPPGKGIQFIKFNLERCSLKFCGDVGLENAVVADPKRVNYGSQGGRILITDSADGTPRSASITSTAPNDLNKLKYDVCLDVSNLSLSTNKEKQSVQMELKSATSMYQEHLEGNNLATKVTLLDMRNAKFVRRSGGLKEISICSLFSATDVSMRWEPDIHIALFELGLRLKLLMQNHKAKEPHKEDTEPKDSSAPEAQKLDKQPKKRENIFAIDVETLNISAEAGDGVETTILVKSIFSENARIGLLLEGFILHFNNARILRSSRMQISRIPNSSSNSVSNAKAGGFTTWDWVIQALDVHIFVPYRLELRAIDDSIEEMIRALKLVTSAKTKLMFPNKEAKPKPPKKTSSSKIGRVRICIRKLSAELEEEPVQGWLDEHYHLMKNGARELAVRMNFLEKLALKSVQSPSVADQSDSVLDQKIHLNGEEIDLQNSAIQKLQEEMYKQTFRSYYQACQNLDPSLGSGACREGFQSGFRPSAARISLFSLCATELDVSLTRIEGGDAGMIELLQKLDPVCRAHNIPFSRLYGSNINLQTGSLSVRIRNYTCPLFSATSGRCEGRLVMAQQATCFQPQVRQNVYIGRWRKVSLLRSASGTTPPMKTYSDLPLHFQKAEISYGVGFEPSFTDISYVFSVALRRANLSIRNPNPDPPPPKKEKSLPWWDEMRNYIHGKTSIYFAETRWNILATSDPYEESDKLLVLSGNMELKQADGCINASVKDFKILLSSLERFIKNSNLNFPVGSSCTFLEAPDFSVEVTMEWECDSGNPLNHYLFALPAEGVPREKVYDPFRSTALTLSWNVLLRPSCHSQSDPGCDSLNSPTINAGPHDLAWLIKFWNLNYLPPNKIRTFSRWPRFGIPRIPRSGNLSLDKVMTEFMFRIDSTPTCIRYMTLEDDDPAKGLTFELKRLKLEIYLGRGQQKFTFESVRDPLDLVYQCVDLHMPKVFILKEKCTSVAQIIQLTRKASQSASMKQIGNDKSESESISGSKEGHPDDGFLLSSDFFTIKRQSPRADPERLLAWQESFGRDLEMTDVRSEFENGSESEDHARSEFTDGDGCNVVIADNCQRVLVYGLKLLWNLENRAAVFSFVVGLANAFEPPKPSPSRQYTQMKLLEEKSKVVENPETSLDELQKSPPSQDVSSSPPQNEGTSEPQLQRSTSNSVKVESPNATAKPKTIEESDGEGTRHFMVNVIEPQFNLHSEDANGRFLLAAASGRVLARSFHSVMHIGSEVIEQSLRGNVQNSEYLPQLTWSRMEFSMMLEHVQAHVAPTDVDLGAGVQWLPRISKSSPKVKRTGALLEQVFMPCDMFFRYTRHKAGSPDLKVKPLKELSFNSQNITATMTSRQFQVMTDVLTNLLLARAPKARKASLSYPVEDDDVEEEADEVVPYGVEEVELAKINLEQEERAVMLILDDIRKLSIQNDVCAEECLEKEFEPWMVTSGRSILVKKLKEELASAKKSRKAAYASLRTALQKAAQIRLMEKEKNRSPSHAMRIYLKINKVAWSMLIDGKPFAEAEINEMIYDFDRDYKDVGVAKFTIKFFVIRNCLPNAKCDMVLSAWNPPPEWGKKVMLHVDAKQAPPKDGHSPIELFQVEIYPLKIHLAETMYKMMWEYLFPEEEQDSHRRQEVWKVSTSAGLRRGKKGSPALEAPAATSPLTKESHSSSKASTPSVPQPSFADSSDGPKLRRTASFDRTWEENVAESIANELVSKVQSSGTSTSKGSLELPDDTVKIKSKDSKLVKSGREEKKAVKANDEKRPRRMREFQNIKISQVELSVTYEGSRFAVSDLRLLMDTFHCAEFTGTWGRLFSRVKKHIIWGILKSVTGMQIKKFKIGKDHSQKDSGGNGPAIEHNHSDSDGGLTAGTSEQHPLSWPKRPSDGAGDGFVTSVRGLFSSHRRKAKNLVLRTMRGEAENDLHGGEWSESEAEFSPLARQLSGSKARKLIRRYTKKFNPKLHKGSSTVDGESIPSSPHDAMYDSDASSESSPCEDYRELE
ncbi:unnamed protein product [Cuscuta epithymum]|uniref:FMP27/BLTP2/Hobbit GFWDK motif-containing RBG unit domain-containing protein n=1 Tax=Cuscuta epithymum TaxID=186058 RepID=A0AAV0C6M7_9ASTE|nr:unnamed protein product [Cuscuta epithymum]